MVSERQFEKNLFVARFTPRACGPLVHVEKCKRTPIRIPYYEHED